MLPRMEVLVREIPDKKLGSALTVLVVRFCARPWFAQGLEVWRILLGYPFKCVRDSGEQRQEFIHTSFRHGPRF